MKKLRVNKFVFLLSLLFNVGAGLIYCHWARNTFEINAHIKNVQGQLDLFGHSSNGYYRVCYADKACSLAAMDDGTYFFSTSQFGDMVSLGVMLVNGIGDSNSKERCYMVGGRGFVTFWKYRGDGSCYDVIHQYNGGPLMRDEQGNGVFKCFQHNEKLNYSERAYKACGDRVRQSNKDSHPTRILPI